MDNLNNLLIDGTLITNPEIVVANNGNRLVKFSIASNRVFVDTEGNKQKEVLFLPVVAYGSLAELCLKHIAKGITVRIAGRIRNNPEENNLELLAQHIEFKRCATKKSHKEEEEE